MTLGSFYGLIERMCISVFNGRSLNVTWRAPQTLHFLVSAPVSLSTPSRGGPTKKVMVQTISFPCKAISDTKASEWRPTREGMYVDGSCADAFTHTSLPIDIVASTLACATKRSSRTSSCWRSLEVRQETISSLRRSITVITRCQTRSPLLVSVNMTPRLSVALVSLSTRPCSTNDCAALLAWPLFKLALCARSLTDSGLNAPIAARHRPSLNGIPASS